MRRLMIILVSVFCLAVLVGNVTADPNNYSEQFGTDPNSRGWAYQSDRVPDSMYWEDNATHGGIVNGTFYRHSGEVSWYYVTDLDTVIGKPMDNTWDWTVSFQVYEVGGYKNYPRFALTSDGFIGNIYITNPQYFIKYCPHPQYRRSKFYYDTYEGGTDDSDWSANDTYTRGEWYVVEMSYDTADSNLYCRVVVDGNDVWTWETDITGAFSFKTFVMWDYYNSSEPQSSNQLFDNLWIGNTADYDAATPVEVTSQPKSLSVDDGANVQFAITATDANTYQWYKGDVAINTSDANFAGADSNALTVYDVDQADGDTDTYYCYASNAVFSKDSLKAVLAIKDMVVHYKFDEGSGSTAADSSGYDNDANVIGATFVAVGPVDGGSISFDDPNDECLLLSAANDVPVLGLPYTIEVWMNLDEDANNAVVAQKMVSYGDSLGSELTFHVTDYGSGDADDDSSIRVQWEAIGTFKADVYASYIDVIGNWVHYATTFDGTEVVVYVNGQKLYDEQPETIYNTNNADDFKIGGGGTRGIIDDMKIYNYARSATQIADAVYAVTGSPVCLEALGYSDRSESLDFNNDCKVGFADLADFVGNWLDDNLYTP
ncbi:MAG: hypothetical protein K8R02_06410 [Anaerohalosphaeraceae bacterium]|nr:hypothetical protein [Anaerohalosphaeraceae bacterium]